MILGMILIRHACILAVRPVTQSYFHNRRISKTRRWGSYAGQQTAACLTSPDWEPSGTGAPSGAGGNNVGLNIWSVVTNG